MGTHPIFESDFDCLTEMIRLVNFRISASRRAKKQLIRASDLPKVEEKPLLSKVFHDNTHWMKVAKVKYEYGSKKFRTSVRGMISLAVLGILCSIKRVWVEWNEKELSLDVQEKQWPHLEEVLMPFTSDGNISDAKNIKLEQIEMISRNGFLWNTDLWNVQGRSTRDKLRALLYYQPVLQHRIELYVGLIDYLQRSFLTGVQNELRIISERLGETEEKKVEDESQINLWYLQIMSTINEKTEKIKKLFLGETKGSINQVKPKMNTIVIVNDFMILIRKYPALFHYIIHLDLENDLNEITKVTNHQDVALLINIIDNRANHSFQLRQDLYNLLKDGDGLVDFIVHPDVGIVEAAKLIDQSEAGEFKSRVSKNCRDILKLYLVHSLQKHERD